MAANKAPVVSTRLKREDCKRTKHDSAFSEWKILIGPSDWEDHSLGKEGAARYRVHNLPNCYSCPGVYELGTAIPHIRSGRLVGKVSPDYIIPVYIGQTDNARTRLQRYGQMGAHLENGTSTGGLNDCGLNGLGLFTEIFSRGCPIVFRWAPMKNKSDAEKTESQLLEAFDYAWNKGSNGSRRCDDIFQKLNQRSSGSTLFPAIVRKLQCRQKQVGVRIKACEPLSIIYTNPESNDLLSRIFKFGRSQPRLVSMKFGVNADIDSICGIAIGHGSVCRRPAVQGRKRCAEHKGMKVNSSISKFITEGKSNGFDMGAEFGVGRNPECDGHQAPSLSFCTVKPQLVAGNCNDNKNFPICGVTLDDGSPCRSYALQGRKRCEEHKGRRIHGFISASTTEEKPHYIRGPELESNSCHTDYEQVSSDMSTTGGLQCHVFSENSVVNKGYAAVCGVNLEGGIFCTRRPVVGLKRCEEHKGMRIRKSISKSLVAGYRPSLLDGSSNSASKNQNYNDTSSQSVSYRNFDEDITSICGATLVNGSVCRRQPVEGRKRCWQHKGMRASSSLSYNSISMYDSGGIPSHICGAGLQNGSICRRMPVHGRKRCEQHKGMRAA